MNFSTVKSVLNNAISRRANFFVGSIGQAIGPDEAASLKDAASGDDLLLLDKIHQRLEDASNQVCIHRLRKRVHHAHARLSGWGSRASLVLDRPANRMSPHSYFRGGGWRTGHGEHQGRGIAEIAIELDWPGALRQAAADGVKLEIYIAELLLCVFDAVIQLDIDQREAGKTERTDAEVRCRRRPDKRVLRHRLFDRPADQLLHLLRRRSRPLRAGDRHPNRDARVLALGHLLKAIPAPDEDGQQEDERNLAVFGKEARSVVRMLDQVGFGSKSHERLRAPDLGNNANYVSIFHQAHSGGDDPLPGRNTPGNCDHVAKGFAKFHRA